AHWGFDPPTAACDPRQAGAALTDAFAAAADRGVEASGIWTAGAVRTAVASTAGVRETDAVTDAYLRVLCDRGGRTGFAARASTAAGDLEAAAAVHEAAAKASSEEPAELAPGEYPAVLEPGAVGTLLEFLGALAFNGLAQAEGRSALSGRLGTRVAAAAINLSDSPRFRSTLPLRDVRFTDEALGLLDRTEALSARLRLVCEGEFYGRRFATGVVCPAIRVSALRVTGSTTPRS